MIRRVRQSMYDLVTSYSCSTTSPLTTKLGIQEPHRNTLLTAATSPNITWVKKVILRIKGRNFAVELPFSFDSVEAIIYKYL